MNQFEKSENLGRKLLATVLEAGKVDEYWFSEDQYSFWDAKYKKNDKEYLVEIKVRNASFDQYPDWILEKKKYEALVAENSNAVYVNFFSDGYFAFWHLGTVDSSSAISKGCKATTAAYNGYKNKEVILLDLKDAAIFGKIENERVLKCTL